jgi:tripartite-type tricarboxylate transporter receptor subunit TctC
VLQSLSTATLRALAGAFLAVCALHPGMARGQGYPAKPVRLIVAFAAGGPADLFARALANEMSSELGQQVFVENRTGAAGVAGIDAVAKSAPDGYTLGLAGAAALSSVPFMIAKMPFDWQKDLTMLTLVARVPEVITINAKLSARTGAEFVAYAKANPGKISFGSAGVGSITHLAAELFKTEAKIDIVHIPYRGAAPAVNDLLGGHVDMVVADVPVLLPHIQAGEIRAIAVTSASRTKTLPDVPTTAEVGYPKVLSDNWYGLVAPAGLPANIVEKIHTAAVAALKSSELAKQFALQAAIPSPTSPAEFSAFVKSEQAKWGPVVTATGAKFE